MGLILVMPGIFLSAMIREIQSLPMLVSSSKRGFLFFFFNFCLFFYFQCELQERGPLFQSELYLGVLTL